MLSPEEFSEFLTTLTTDELHEYQKIIMDETYNRIVFKGPKPVKNKGRKKEPKKKKFPNFEKLPWTMKDRLPGNTNIMKKLGWYHPSECTAESLESQVKVFAKIMKQLERSDRILASIKMFELFDANKWYLTENQRFSESVVKKLDTLAQDPSPIANAIAEDFNHLRKAISPKWISISDSETSLIRKKQKLCSPPTPVKTVLCDDSDSDSEPEDTTPFSKLPWTTVNDLPKNTTAVLRKLAHFSPDKYDLETLENQLRILAHVLFITHGRVSKAKIAKNIFKIIDKNSWYLDTNYSFGMGITELQLKFENRNVNDLFDYSELKALIENMDHDCDVGLTKFTAVPPKPFNHLPWDMYNLPTWQTILLELEYFKPVKCSKEDFVKDVRLFLHIVNITSGEKNKLRVVRHLYNFLAVNEWIMKENEKFHKTVVGKLDEFIQYDYPEAVKLVNDFAYFRNLNNEDANLEPLIPTEADSDFEAEGDPTGTNGDSLPYPKVTKEQLDREIDRYMAVGRSKITVKSNYLSDSESSS